METYVGPPCMGLYHPSMISDLPIDSLCVLGLREGVKSSANTTGSVSDPLSEIGLRGQVPWGSGGNLDESCLGIPRKTYFYLFFLIFGVFLIKY